MRNLLKRYYGQGDVHFITFSCYQRRPLLGTDRARNCFVKVLDQLRSQKNFRLFGFVVMPEHVHVLMGEPEGSDPSKILQLLKQKVSRALRKTRAKAPVKQLPVRFAADVDEGMHFWQRRFYDFNVWSDRRFREKLDYMHANPVKRGLVLDSKDWPWSSWSSYARGEGGLIRIDSIEEALMSNEGRGVQGKKRQKPHP